MHFTTFVIRAASLTLRGETFVSRFLVAALPRCASAVNISRKSNQVI